MPDFYINEWPPFSPEDEARKDNVRLAARLMVNAALTAPCIGGNAAVEAHLVYGRKEMDELAKKMLELARENPRNKFWKNIFKYEATMIREQTDAVVFLGSWNAADDPFDIGCGRCGGIPRLCWLYEKRAIRAGKIDMTESQPTTLVDGPLCMIRTTALGFAMGAAMWMSYRLLVDSRPFMSVGIAGQKLGYCPNSQIVVGIPVAAYSKNAYVDIRPDYHVLSQWKAVQAMRKYYPLFRLGGGQGDYRDSFPFVTPEAEGEEE